MSTAEAIKKNKFSVAVGTAFKVLFIVIYGCGYHIERLALAILRLMAKIVSVGIFRAICAVGEWVIATGKKIGQALLKLGMAIADSFVTDFSWWAPIIGALGIVTILVLSNFFTVAIEVKINDNSVGYVKSEREYQEVLSQVENNIQAQLDRTATVQTEKEKEQAKQDSEDDDKQVHQLSTLDNDTKVPQKEAQIQTAEAANMADLRLGGESYSLTTTATYQLGLIRKSDLANEEDLYTDVYSAVTELVGTNYGLYIEGELKAAAADEATIQKVLDEIKAPYEKDEENTRIDFIQDVKVKKGMFASDMIKTEEQLRAMFQNNSDKPAYYICKEGEYLSTIAKKFGMTRAQLLAANPNLKETELYGGKRINIAAPDIFLQVKTIKTETYTVDIDYSTKRKGTNDLYVGNTKVQTEGKKGVKRVTAEITYVDGKRTDKNIVDTKVITKPVDKVILVGTKKKQSRSYSSSGSGYVSGNFSQGSGTPSGNFTCPLPGCYLSCGFMGYSGHTGADLCLRGGTLNAAVHAADGGVVEASGWSGGYGNLIRINHGNGFVTYYAHLNARYVATGDRVSKGQVIGRAGSTGNSTGPHLHFEVRYHGSAYNPLRYISI